MIAYTSLHNLEEVFNIPTTTKMKFSYLFFQYYVFRHIEVNPVILVTKEKYPE